MSNSSDLEPHVSTRRTFVRGALSAGALVAAGCRPGERGDPPARPGQAPAVVRSDSARPELLYGVQSGDVTSTGAVLWAAADRPARMLIEVATSDRFTDARRIDGPAMRAATGFTGKQVVSGLPADRPMFYRVTLQDLGDPRVLSRPVTGQFRTAPAPHPGPGSGPGPAPRSIRFLWSGDTVGQGWGINPDLGGMTIYRTMAARRPDFFIHSGDYIYADGPIEAEVSLPDGSTWRNLTLEGKHKVAETQDEFRACYRYNLLDENLRRFNAEVPQLVQWDDHETVNNWYPGEVLPADDSRYRVKGVDQLSGRARRAFLEWTPMITPATAPEQIYRKFEYGPLLEVFMLDLRSYRGPNSVNRQAVRGPETAYLGDPQLEWLKTSLRASRATWKVIASDLPIGLVVDDGAHFENCANGDGPPLGRELEIAELLRFVKQHRVRNTVWLTADVHYTAAHYYDPARARFTDFDPFWEFVSGPLNAGTFGPNPLDDTFGPQVTFQKAPPPGQQNLPPSAGYQFFGEVVIDGKTAAMTVLLKDLTGATLHTVELAPS